MLAGAQVDAGGGQHCAHVADFLHAALHGHVPLPLLHLGLQRLGGEGEQQQSETSRFVSSEQRSRLDVHSQGALALIWSAFWTTVVPGGKSEGRESASMMSSSSVFVYVLMMQRSSSDAIRGSASEAVAAER